MTTPIDTPLRDLRINRGNAAKRIAEAVRATAAPVQSFVLRRVADRSRTSRAHSRASVDRSNSSSASVTATEKTAVFASGFRGRPAPGRFPPRFEGDFSIPELLIKFQKNQPQAVDPVFDFRIIKSDTRGKPMAKTTVYRLSNDHRLPLHWCYCEAWEKNDHAVWVGPRENDWDLEEEIVDNRAEGAQVWDDLESVLAAIRGEAGVDGDYSDYGLLLVIDGDDTVDGGYWNAVVKGDVTRVRSVAIDDLPIDEATQEIAAAVERLAKDEQIEWYESLPCPWED